MAIFMQTESVQGKMWVYWRGIQQNLFMRILQLASLGAVAVQINFQLAAREVAYIIQDASIRLLIVDEPCKLELKLKEFGYKQTLSQISFGEIKTALKQQAYEKVPGIPVVSKGETICAMIYISGTTGVHKGALLTYRNLTSNAKMFLKAVDMQPDDTVLCVLPMYHCFAWTCAVLNPLLAGVRITILEAFAPKEMAAVVRRFCVSVVYAVLFAIYCCVRLKGVL